MFVREHVPRTAEEASDFAELCFSLKTHKRQDNKAGLKGQSQRKWNAKNENGFAQTEAKQDLASAGSQIAQKATSDECRNFDSSLKKPNVCFKCEGPHKAAQCPNKAAKKVYGKNSQTTALTTEMNRKDVSPRDENFVVPLYVNGIECISFRDTASTLTIVLSKYVGDCQYTGEKVTVAGFDGTRKELALAKVLISSPCLKATQPQLVEVAVTNGKLAFGVDCLLGNSLFESNMFTDIITVTPKSDMHDMKTSSKQQDSTPGDRTLVQAEVSLTDSAKQHIVPIDTDTCDSVCKMTTIAAVDSVAQVATQNKQTK
jgi:hypothetical protein